MSDENLVGQTLAGKYRVEKVLGKGGMGLVVGARHLKLDEPVAIKVLRPAMMEVAGMVSRFLREARAASKIKSEHVVRVTDVDTRDDGVPYMVMEHLEGIDFAELRKQKGTFGIAEAVGYVLEACEAIAEAHDLGIVHRDLKPGNLFLHTRRDGRRVVKVLDFGISKLDAPGEQDTTKTGQMMGSPKYMSPEQMLNMREVDGRSDIWSLGAILFELLCGRPPFIGDTTPRICAQVLNSDPPLPHTLRADLPPELEIVILRCLDKEPDRRFSDVRALVTALTPYGPPPEVLLSSGTRPAPALVVAAPLPSAGSAGHTPTPGTAAGTVAAWDTTKYVGPKKKASSSRGVAVGAAVVAIGVAAAIWATRGGRVEATAASASASSAAPIEPSAIVAASASAASPRATGMSPNDLPDVEPQPASAKPIGTAAPGSVAKKPKPAPSADPFGGRRN